MMQIDINELIELVKSVKSMFLNHTEAEHVTVKGRADFVTQVDIRVQEYMRSDGRTYSSWVRKKITAI